MPECKQGIIHVLSTYLCFNTMCEHKCFYNYVYLLKFECLVYSSLLVVYYNLLFLCVLKLYLIWKHNKRNNVNMGIQKKRSNWNGSDFWRDAINVWNCYWFQKNKDANIFCVFRKDPLVLDSTFLTDARVLTNTYMN